MFHSDEFSSVQDSISVLGKPHISSTRSLGSFPKVDLELGTMFEFFTMTCFLPYQGRS